GGNRCSFRGLLLLRACRVGRAGKTNVFYVVGGMWSLDIEAACVSVGRIVFCGVYLGRA
ncbi:MAG: hypothetical protein RLZZ192_1199, partial [Pseudomonadota bacterium]